MPASDPINPNVHPLIYRLNYDLRASAGGRTGSRRQGRNHLQRNLHEFLGRRDGVGRMVAQRSRPAHRGGQRTYRHPRGQQKRDPPTGRRDKSAAAAPGSGRVFRPGHRPLPPPPDITPRTRVSSTLDGWKWRLRDIVDYELIGDFRAARDRAADRETLLHKIYDINANTIDRGKKGELGFGDQEKEFRSHHSGRGPAGSE